MKEKIKMNLINLFNSYIFFLCTNILSRNEETYLKHIHIYSFS